MDYMSIVMALPRTGAGGLVEGRTQGVVRGLGGGPGQGYLPLRVCPLRGHSPWASPVPQYRMEDSGMAA